MATFLKDIKSKSEKKILYLDQNMWIYLAQVFYGKNKNPLLTDILTELQLLVKEDKVLIVINLTNVIEARKVIDDTRVIKFAEFVASLSKMYAFIPFPFIEIFEVDNILRIELGEELIDVRARAIGKGVLYLIHDGNPPRIEIQGKLIPKELHKEADKAVINHFTSKKAFVDFFLMKSDDSHLNETINKLEDIRKEGLKLRDKVFKKKLGVAQFYANMIIEKVALMCKLKEAHPSILRLNEGMERIMEVFKNMPLLYTYHILHRGLDEVPDHPIDTHDLQDIYSFCFPLPYCDIVVGEKYVIKLARKYQIDSLYDTLLFTVGELNPFLELLKEL